MKIKELLIILEELKLDPETEIVLASDREGNRYELLDGFSEGKFDFDADDPWPDPDLEAKGEFVLALFPMR
jgi:hypothetical protein